MSWSEIERGLSIGLEVPIVIVALWQLLYIRRHGGVKTPVHRMKQNMRINLVVQALPGLLIAIDPSGAFGILPYWLMSIGQGWWALCQFAILGHWAVGSLKVFDSDVEAPVTRGFRNVFITLIVGYAILCPALEITAHVTGDFHWVGGDYVVYGVILVIFPATAFLSSLVLMSKVRSAAAVGSAARATGDLESPRTPGAQSPQQVFRRTVIRTFVLLILLAFLLVSALWYTWPMAAAAIQCDVIYDVEGPRIQPEGAGYDGNIAQWMSFAILYYVCWYVMPVNLLCRAKRIAPAQPVDPQAAKAPVGEELSLPPPDSLSSSNSLHYVIRVQQTGGALLQLPDTVVEDDLPVDAHPLRSKQHPHTAPNSMITAPHFLSIHELSNHGASLAPPPSLNTSIIAEREVSGTALRSSVADQSLRSLSEHPSDNHVGRQLGLQLSLPLA